MLKRNRKRAYFLTIITFKFPKFVEEKKYNT